MPVLVSRWALEGGAHVESYFNNKPRAANATRGQYPSNAPGETRTPNLLIRSQMLYPIELRAHRKNCELRILRTEVGISLPGISYGRYKTRTCDLHDVNVAL